MIITSNKIELRVKQQQTNKNKTKQNKQTNKHKTNKQKTPEAIFSLWAYYSEYTDVCSRN